MLWKSRLNQHLNVDDFCVFHFLQSLKSKETVSSRMHISIRTGWKRNDYQKQVTTSLMSYLMDSINNTISIAVSRRQHMHVVQFGFVFIQPYHHWSVEWTCRFLVCIFRHFCCAIMPCSFICNHKIFSWVPSVLWLVSLYIFYASWQEWCHFWMLQWKPRLHNSEHLHKCIA
jgi:hypothetical protein